VRIGCAASESKWGQQPQEPELRASLVAAVLLGVQGPSGAVVLAGFA